MQITLEVLEAKKKEYEAGYFEHMALANANHGALEAIQDLIEKIKAQPNADQISN